MLKTLALDSELSLIWLHCTPIHFYCFTHMGVAGGGGVSQKDKHSHSGPVWNQQLACPQKRIPESNLGTSCCEAPTAAPPPHCTPLRSQTVGDLGRLACNVFGAEEVVRAAGEHLLLLETGFICRLHNPEIKFTIVHLLCGWKLDDVSLFQKIDWIVFFF